MILSIGLSIIPLWHMWNIKLLLNFISLCTRDGNGAGFFGYPPRPAPNGTKLNFIKRVWDGFGNGLKNPERGGAGWGNPPSHFCPWTLPPFWVWQFLVAGNQRASSPLPRLTGEDTKRRTGRGSWPVQVVILSDSTIGDLIAAALRQYAKERRQRYPQRSDRGSTVVCEGGVVVGFTHRDLITAALR